MTHLDDDNDESLMRRLVKCDHQAFSVLVRRHSEVFYRAAYKVVMNKEDAEDIVQSSFLKIWDRPTLWKGGKGASFKTWFYKIIMNACIDFKRKRKDITGTDLTDNVCTPELLADKKIILSEQQRLVEEAIATLPVKQRAAVTLFYEDELKQKEAAEILGLSVKAFESLLSRAKKTLHDYILRQDETRRRA
jgi:RNA polymerase sigma-70 factor (ECF subfamily)